MLITTMYRREGKENLVICGHLNDEEVDRLVLEGWAAKEDGLNKHGIPIRRLVGGSGGEKGVKGGFFGR